jgi:hypothetical protein
MDKIHILPINDIHPHIEEDSCKCQPKVQHVEGGTLVIHNSYDGREVLEDWEENKGKFVQ